MPTAWTPSNHGLKNVFRPSAMVPKPYGWNRSPAYHKGDIPRVPGGEFIQSMAYEWLGSNLTEFPEMQDYSNPPFLSGAAGRITSAMRGESDTPRILRGYIRRASRDPADDKSKARLYFMYNPAEIARQYLSYLDQEALDPFNSVYSSGNLVAPPSLVDFSFELFFDRQAEATDASHPGVLVDYQFFDMVVRNVNPDPSMNTTGLPDNGVMMINPQMVTVVFSPHLTVQGYPTNASVMFHKFTHRMTPIRMSINLQIRAVYFGPITDQPVWKDTYVEIAAEQSTPWYEEHALEITVGDIQENLLQGLLSTVQNMFGGSGSSVPGQAASSSSATAGQALDWARANVREGVTFYTQNSPGRISPPTSADCSGLVWSAYNGIGARDALGLHEHGDNVDSMVSTWKSDNFAKCQIVFDLTNPQGKQALRNAPTSVQAGDLAVRHNVPGKSNHIAFVVSGGDRFTLFDAAGKSATPNVGQRTVSLDNIAGYAYILRPATGGATTANRYVNQAQPTWSVRSGQVS